MDNLKPFRWLLALAFVGLAIFQVYLYFTYQKLGNPDYPALQLIGNLILDAAFIILIFEPKIVWQKILAVALAFVAFGITLYTYYAAL